MRSHPSFHPAASATGALWGAPRGSWCVRSAEFARRHRVQRQRDVKRVWALAGRHSRGDCYLPLNDHLCRPSYPASSQRSAPHRIASHLIPSLHAHPAPYIVRRSVTYRKRRDYDSSGGAPGGWGARRSASAAARARNQPRPIAPANHANRAIRHGMTGSSRHAAASAPEPVPAQPSRLRHIAAPSHACGHAPCAHAHLPPHATTRPQRPSRPATLCYNGRRSSSRGRGQRSAVRPTRWSG